jgi:hypothetical protein
MGRWDEDFEDDEQEFVEPKKAEPELTRKTIGNRPQDAKSDEDMEAPKQGLRVVKAGWGSSERTSGESGEYAKRLKVTNEIQIIKFLDDAPYARYRQHWVERKGQMSFTCIADYEAGVTCPLCEAGNRPSWRFNFNVVLLTQGEEPVLRSYEVGARVIDQLKNFNDHPAMGPLYKHYWTVSRSGKGATTSTNHQMVRESDLADWGLAPLTKDALNTFSENAYTDDIIRIPSRSTLAGIAMEIADDTE